MAVTQFNLRKQSAKQNMHIETTCTPDPKILNNFSDDNH